MITKTTLYDMKHKKDYAVPRVLQTLEVRLEEDFLVGGSNMSMIQATGHDLNYYDIDTQTQGAVDNWNLD